VFNMNRDRISHTQLRAAVMLVSLFNLDDKTRMEFFPHCARENAKRLGRSALFSNHLPNIPGVCADSERRALFKADGFNLDIFWVIRNQPNSLQEPLMNLFALGHKLFLDVFRFENLTFFTSLATRSIFWIAGADALPSQLQMVVVSTPICVATSDWKSYGCGHLSY